MKHGARETKDIDELTLEQTQEMLVDSRVIYEALDHAAAKFCRKHNLLGEDHFARTILCMYEAIAFGVIANNIAHEYHTEVVNSLAGGLFARLKEFRKDPRDFVKYDA
jgi:hypothetical protein